MMITIDDTNKYKQIVQFGRNLRTAAYKALSPLDYIFRTLNQVGYYPPLHLRRHVGGMNSGFNGPGYEFAAYLRLLAGLQTGNSLWDFGCGCGMLELALQDLGWRGRLVGTDIHKPCVEWAKKHIQLGSDISNFIHADIYNPFYWPKGKLTTKEWLPIFIEKDFDVVIAKSLFTHILQDELHTYLKGIADRLKPGGKALLTFFIHSAENAHYTSSGRNKLSFIPYDKEENCFVRNLHAPTAAVAYSQQYIMDSLRIAGFDLKETTLHYGTWSGRPDGLSFQDVIVAGKSLIQQPSA